MNIAKKNISTENGTIKGTHLTLKLQEGTIKERIDSRVTCYREASVNSGAKSK